MIHLNAISNIERNSISVDAHEGTVTCVRFNGKNIIVSGSEVTFCFAFLTLAGSKDQNMEPQQPK